MHGEQRYFMRGGVGKLSRFYRFGVCEMSDTKFTPGPWVFNGNEIVAANEPGKGIAGAMREEDCRLMAASPDLYEALTNTIQFAEACHRQCSDELMRQAIGADIAKAHAALSKARGES